MKKSHAKKVSEKTPQTHPKRLRGTKGRKGPSVPARKVGASDEFQSWMDNYLALEREIMAERDRREAHRQKRRDERHDALTRAFGDFCEATQGRAVIWREEGFRSLDMAFEMAIDVWTRKTAERYFRLAGRAMPGGSRFTALTSFLVLSCSLLSTNTGVWASFYALRMIVRGTSMLIGHLKQRAIRPLYYEQETARRRALAATRRRIQKRTTLNACPTKEAILDAYRHRKESKEAALLFGSLLHDLECYVDNSLRFVNGRITGRNEGVKGWLSENIPVLACKYTTLMRYKAAAKKLKQLVELDDPIPAEAVLTGGLVLFTPSPEMAHTAQTALPQTDAMMHAPSADPARFSKRPALRGQIPHEKTLRAMAIYRELAEGVENATQMMAKIDAFLDPARVAETNMLSIWRARYQNEITMRNKTTWWRRLMCGGHGWRAEGRHEEGDRVNVCRGDVHCGGVRCGDVHCGGVRRGDVHCGGVRREDRDRVDRGGMDARRAAGLAG